MKINSNLNHYQKSTNFKGNLYNSKLFKKSLVFASDNSALFCATTSLLFSLIARPLSILAAPKTDSENKKYAISKSISSSLIGYLLMLLVTKPFASALKNIDSNPAKYLNQNTIKNLQENAQNLNLSKKYKFATQLFKLGLGLVVAVPKSALTAYFTPKIMKKFFNKNNKEDKINKKDKNSNKDVNNNKNKNNNENKIQFKGNNNKITNYAVEKLSCAVGSLINTKTVQNLADKFQNTNYERNLMFLTDVVLTGVFVNKTLKNKEIEEKRKNPLIYNSILSTGFSILSSLALDKITDKQYQKFVAKFCEVNKNSSYLDKFKDGLKISKTALIMASVYYIVIPVVSTFLAQRIDEFKNKNKNDNDNLR